MQVLIQFEAVEEYLNTYKTKWKNANISKTTKTQRSPICVHSNFMCCGSVTYTCDKIIIRMILWNFCTATFCGLESVAFLFQLSNYPYYKYWSKCQSRYPQGKTLGTDILWMLPRAPIPVYKLQKGVNMWEFYFPIVNCENRYFFRDESSTLASIVFLLSSV